MDSLLHTESHARADVPQTFLMSSLRDSSQEPSGQGLPGCSDGQPVFDDILGTGLDNVADDAIDAFRVGEGIVRSHANDDVGIRYGRRPKVAGKHVTLASTETVDVMPATFLNDDVVSWMDCCRNDYLIQTLCMT